jgi:hypothetical protein
MRQIVPSKRVRASRNVGFKPRAVADVGCS